MQRNTVDRQSLRVWLLLAILGAILSVVGWSRVFLIVLAAQDASLRLSRSRPSSRTNRGTSSVVMCPQPGGASGDQCHAP